jgi:hypothetical protein
MSDFWTDPNLQGISRTGRDLYNFALDARGVQQGIMGGLGGFFRQPYDWLMSQKPNIDFSPRFIGGPGRTRPGTSKGTGPTLGPDGKPLIPASPTTGGLLDPNRNKPQLSPLEQLQYDMYTQMLGASSGGRSVDLSGYDSALNMLNEEKGRVSNRYKKYSGQIADIYGTLTGITQSDIENIQPRSESLRSGLSAQEAERASATRAAEEARLATATQAREALGLEDIAGEYAGGDVVTDQAEGMVKDSEAQRSAAENVLLANEAIERSQGQNRITGYGLQQEESARQLQTSLEDALAAIRAERAQIEMQRAQAASQASGGGPDWQTRMAGLQGLQGMGQQAPATDFIGAWMQNNPTAAPLAAPALNNFNAFLQSNYKSLFNEMGEAKINPMIAIERFRQVASPADLRALNDPAVSLFLSQFFNSFGQPPANAR